MVFLEPELEGDVVRLAPLEFRHAAGLAAASAGAGDLYRMTRVPTTEPDAADYVASALAGRTAGTAAPFAVIRLADEAVIGSTRLWDLQWWPWPDGHPRPSPPPPVGRPSRAAAFLNCRLQSRTKTKGLIECSCSA